MEGGLDGRAAQHLREAIHHLGLAVYEECLPHVADATMPGEQVGLVGMRREAVDGVDVRANGDVVTSPFASGNDFTSPVLLAASTSVSPRVGSVTTIEDDPLSPVPNCQRTASPL